MIVKKSDIVIVLISVIVMGINNISLSKYDEGINCNVNSQIAKPIVVLEKDDIVKTRIDQNSFPVEYNFKINNYDGEHVNEISLDYYIQIEASDEKFPVSYILLDCDNNVEVKLTDGKSEIMKLNKNTKESRNFKLCLQWKELDTELASELELKLKVDVVQSKEGNV